MDENVVFNNQENTQNQELPQSQEIPMQQLPNNQVAPPGPPVQPLSSPPPISPDSSLPPPSGFDFSFFSIGNIAKIILAIVVLIVIGFLAFNFVSSRSKKANSENVTLTYWGLWEDSQVFQPIISDFEKQNPKIKINYVKQDAKQYRQRLVTRIENGTGPDIFRFHNTWRRQLSNILLPLPDGTIRKTDFQKWFYPVAQTDLVKNGAIYGIPMQIDTLSLFINPEIFQAAGQKTPSTWDDFSKVASALTVKDETGKIKTAGAAMGTFNNITHAPDVISLLFAQNGVNLENPSQTNKNTMEALEYYNSFVREGENVWDNTQDESILAFAKGNLAMYFGYSWDVFSIKYYNPNASFQIHPVPRLPGRNNTIASYWAEGVSVKSKHQQAALLFMKFLSQKETEQKLFSETSKTRLFGEPYARTDLADSLKDNLMIYPFVSQGKDATSSFFASGTYDEGLNSKMNKYLEDAVNSMLNSSSAETAVETLSKGVSQVLSEYGQ